MVRVVCVGFVVVDLVFRFAELSLVAGKHLADELVTVLGGVAANAAVVAAALGVEAALIFVEVGGYWLWPIAGAYDVLAQDPGYHWSLVGLASREYAWILAREPRLDAPTLAMLRERLAAERYDPCRLIVTAKADARRGQSLCAVP